MNTKPVTDAAALSKIRQTGDHEWTVVDESYADYSSAMNAARASLAGEHALECERRAAELERITGGPHHAGPVNGELRTPAGLREEATAYLRMALEFAMKAPR